MATTIDWGTKNINVQQADLLQIQATPVEIYEHNIDDFRKDLADLLDDPTGIPYDDTHEHTPPKTLAGVTYARLLEIINNYTITYLPNTPWTVSISGGNSNISDRKIPNLVSIQIANSAGLQDSTSLQAASFGGHVTVDIINGVTGTTFPRGTQKTPVNNMVDALAIAVTNGITEFLIVNSITLDVASGDLSGGYHFVGATNSVVVTIDTSALVANASFVALDATGILDGNSRFSQCELNGVTVISTEIHDSGLKGTTIIAGGATNYVEIVDSYSEVAGGGPGAYPVLSLPGTDYNLLVRNWSGGLGIADLNDTNAAISIDMLSGRVIVAASCTAGTITVRGIATVVDNSTGTCVVNDNTIEKKITNTEKVVRNRRQTNPTTGKQTIYDDDSVTVLFEGDLYEDIAGTQTYQGQGADRADRLA